MKTLVKQTHKLLLMLLLLPLVVTVTKANTISYQNWTNPLGVESFQLFFGPAAEQYRPQPVLFTDYVGCPGEMITLSVTPSGGQPPYTINWYSDPGLTNLVGTGASMDVLITIHPVTYYVRITGSNGFSSLQEVVVDIDVPSFYAIPECDPAGEYYILHVFSNSDENSLTSTLGDVIDLGIPAEWKIINIPLDSCVLISMASPAGCVVSEEHCAPDCNPPCDLSVTINGDDSVCEDESASLSAMVNGGTAPYTFNWSNGLTTEVISVPATDVINPYGVTVTDAEGCRDSTAFTVDVIEEPIITMVETVCGEDSMSYTVIVTVEYSTSTTIGGTNFAGEGTFTVENLDLLLPVTIETSNACGDTMTIITPPNCTVECELEVQLDDKVVCADALPTLAPIVTGGVGPYLFAWYDNEEGTGTPLSEDSLFTVPGAGTYYVFVDVENGGCTQGMASSTVEVVELPVLTIDTVYCAEESGMYTVEFSTENETFVIVNGTDLPLTPPYSFTANVDDTINIEVGNSCDTLTASVTSDGLDCGDCDLEVMISVQDTTICAGASVTLEAIVTGGTEPFNYLWSPGGETTSSITVTPDETTEYIVEISDDEQCTASDSSTVTVVQLPIITIDSVYCGPDGTYIVEFSVDGSSTVTANGEELSGPPYVYTAMQKAEVTLVATNACGETTEEVMPPNCDCDLEVMISVGDTTICAGDTVIMEAIVTGGTEPFDYLWSPGGETTSSITVTPEETTEYTITVNDSEQCTASDTSMITVIELPIITTDTVYCGPNGDYIVEFSVDGATTVSANGETLSGPPYSYSVALGTELTLMATNECGETTQEVTPPNCDGCDLSVVVADTTICRGQEITLEAMVTGGTAPFAYIWSPGGETTSSITISPEVSTQYTVTVTDIEDCEAVDSAMVTVINDPVVLNTSISCGPEVGEYTAQFTVQNADFVTINGNSVAVMPNYTYTTTLDSSIIVVAGNICDTTTLEVSGEFLNCCDLEVTLNDTLVCDGLPVTLTPTVTGGEPPYTFAWYDNPDGTGTPLGEDPQFTAPVSGTYYVFVDDQDDNCPGVMDSSVVVISELPVLSIDSVYCSEEAGYYTVEFTAQNETFVIVNGTNLTVMPAPYTYTTVLDSTIKIEIGNLCDTITASVNSDDLDCCDLEVMLEDVVECEDSTATLTPMVSGGLPDYTYAWYDNPEGTGTPLGTMMTLEVSASGTYYVFVDDQDSLCPPAMDSAQVTIGDPTIEYEVECDTVSGFYTATITIFNADSLFINGVSYPPIDGATYTVTSPLSQLISVNFENPCLVVGTSILPPTDCCEVIVEIPDTTICLGQSVTLEAFSPTGVPPFSYLWSTSATTFSIEVTPPVTTEYSVTVTDSDTCISIDTVTVFVDKPVELTIDSVYCGPDLGIYTVEFSAPGATTVTANDDPQAIMDGYSVTVPQDSTLTIFASNACGDTTVVVNPPDCECDLTVAVLDTAICLGQTLVLTAELDGGTPDFTYLWSTGATTASISVTPTFNVNYIVTVTDAENCEAIDSAMITVLRPPSLTMISRECAEDSMSYTVVFTTNTPNVTTSHGALMCNNGMCEITDIPLGVIVVITATNECGMLTLPLDPPNCCDLTATLPDTTICVRDQIILSPVIIGGTPEFSYAWSTGDTTAEILVFPAITTTYTVTITDTEQCTATASATITVNPIPRIRLDSVNCADDLEHYLVYLSTQNTDTLIIGSNGTILVEGPPQYLIEVPNDSILTVFASNECGADSLEIYPPPCPNCDLTAIVRDTTICAGDTATLEVEIFGGSGEYLVEWFDNEDCEGPALGMDVSLEVSPTVTTTYYVMVTDTLIDSCFIKVPGTVTIQSEPVIEIVSVDCLEDSLNYQVTLLTSYTNLLATSIGEIDATGAPQYILTVPNDSIVTIIAYNECESDTVIVNPPPPCPYCDLFAEAMIEGGAESICAGDTATLIVTAMGANGEYVIEWYDNPECDGDPLGLDTTLMVSPMETTTYYVMVADTTIDSCMVKVPVEVVVDPLPELILDNVVCAEDSLSYIVTITANNTDSLITSIGLIDVSTVPVYNLIIPKDSSVTVIGFNDCGSDTLVVDPPPCDDCMIMVSVADTTVCAGQPFELEAVVTGSNDFIIEWFDNEEGEGPPISTQLTLVDSLTETFTYYVMVTDNLLDSCFVKDSVTVDVIPLPEITIDTVDCVGDGFTYIVEFSTVGADEIIVSTGEYDPAAGTILVTLPNAVTITAINDCDSTAIEVTAPDCPTCFVDITTTADTTICYGDLVTLVAESLSTDPVQDFKWYDNPACEGDSLGLGPELTVSPLENTFYYVMLTMENGLTCKDSIAVIVTPIFIANEPACASDSASFSIEFFTNTDNVMVMVSEGILSGGDGSYVIDEIPSDVPVTITVVDTILGCMVDTMFVAPECCVNCLEERDITATADNKPDGTTIHFGMQVQLDVQMPDCPGCIFEWSGPATISDPSRKNPVFEPANGIEPDLYTFTVDVTPAGECCPTLRDTVSVCVIPLCEAAVFVPNAFSPNGDDQNDVFRIRAADVDDVYLAIYNRWGEKLKELNSTKDTWDGTFGGKALPPDVYGYYMRARCINGEEIFRKGNITLLR